MGIIYKITKKYSVFKQGYIDHINRRRLTNKNPIIIANDCGGGFIYKFLGLQYRSPFMWLNISSKDYLKILENFDVFMNHEIVEDKRLTKEKGFPVGIGEFDTEIQFRHYATFEDAISKWKKRAARMDRVEQSNGWYHYITDHMGFMITEGYTDRSELKRFAELPFLHKVAFIWDKSNLDIPNTFLLEGWPPDVVLNRTQNWITGRRFIDQFDYVDFLNSL